MSIYRYLVNQYQKQKEDQHYQMVQFEKENDAFYLNTNLNESLSHLCSILSIMNQNNEMSSLELLENIYSSYIEYNHSIESISKRYFSTDFCLPHELNSYYENLIDVTLFLVRKSHNLNPYLIVIEDYLLKLYHFYQLSHPKAFINDHHSLKDYQIHYFLNHHQMGVYYSIDDFKDFTKTSYETSRQSMDTFVDLGIYKKRKIGKKYVYTSILTL